MPRIEVNKTDGRVSESKRRFDERDFKWLAQYVVDEFNRRKDDEERRENEKQWKEIDRQIEMEPDTKFKMLSNGNRDDKKAWMAEMEMPLQAQALEVLTADARRFMFPDVDPWFKANCEVTDDLLEKVDFGAIIHGDKSQVPSQVTQDNFDKLVQGFLLSAFRQYDHEGAFDRINAEAFKYGMGIARPRLETKNVFINEARGTRSEKQRIPVIVPVSIKNVYLDNPKPSMHSSQVLGPAHISHEWCRYENIDIAANKGNTNPDNEDGGWMPKQLAKVNPDKNGFIQLLEIEGDIVVPRKTVRSVVIPNAIITVALGGAESASTPATKAVIRLRFRKHKFSSYLMFPYHYEGSECAYPTGPLMKGRPVQMMVTDALNRCMDAAMLKNAPPVSYDPNDPYFAQQGGPNVHPYALWESADPAAVKAHVEVGGDPAALFQIMMQGVSLYAQLTGVLPARLGAQTISHTTAYAKGTELQQGASRTVDYVNSIGKGSVTRWLDIAYTLGREAMTGENSVYIDDYGGYVTIEKDMLPENVNFEWFGSGGPQEKQQRNMAKIQAAELAVKVDQLRVQLGQPPRVNLEAMIDEILRDGGWRDLAAITSIGQPSTGSQGAPGVPGASPENPGAAIAAIQNLTGAGG